MAEIKVTTRLIPFLGMPLHQSFSPKCHNAVYEEMGWNYFYFPVEVPNKTDFPHIIDGLKRMNIAGMAITKPYKTEALKYLDEIDDIAAKMGSCNTIVKTKTGIIKGYNTDGIGAIQSIEEESDLDFKDSTVFCYGSGGTAKSVCFEIASRSPKRIYIASPSVSCIQLADNINSTYKDSCIAISTADKESIQRAIAESHLIMNLSGVGMMPNTTASPMDKAFILPDKIYFDAIYNPAKTQFLLDAEAGCGRIINGLGMLIHQATKQISLWTGHPEPTEQMKRQMAKIVL